MPELFVSWLGAAPAIDFVAPILVTKIRIKGCERGGAGGNANGPRGGGGGGAGSFLDEIIEPAAGSIMQLRYGGIIGANYTSTFVFRNRAGNVETRQLIQGSPGQTASGAASGNGGDSGNGGRGGVASAANADNVPTGMVGNGFLMHSTGGYAGVNAAPMAFIRDVANSYREEGVPVDIQSYKLKYPSAAPSVAGLGGSGGCSYWGAGGSSYPGGVAIAPGFGGGGSGGNNITAAGQAGGPAFFAIEWQWPD